MRKFFSLFAAVLFAASMMASEVVFTNADFAGQGTQNTGSQVSASKDGVTFTYSKGYSADESLRCYAHGALSISAEEKISKINFTTTGGKTGGLDAEVTVNAWAYEVADLASQARFTEIKVTLGEGGGDEPGGDTPVVPGDAISCAEAVSAAQAGSTAQVTVRGYVTEIAYAWKNGSMSFWMADSKDGGKVFEAYRCECAEADAPVVGDLVEATGNLTMYNTTAELAAGCTVVIIERGEGGGDTPAVGGDTLTCANARQLALDGNTDERVIKGYVTKIVAAWQERYKNVSFWMADTKDGGEVFEAFRVVCQTEAESPAEGDLVWVKGNLTKYEKDGNVTPETAQGGSFGILVKAGGSTPVVTDPTNCAEAAAAALSVSENNELYNGGKEYTIQGFVTSIAFPWKEGTMSFWMADTENGGNVLEAYKCAVENEADAVRVGDKVAVTGKLTKYNKTPEFAAGCTVEIIERAPEDPNPPVVLGEMTIAEFLELKNFKDTCILTGVVANIVMDKQDETQYNKYGNFDLVELDNEEVQVYIYGLLTADGVAQQFNEMGIDEGDTLVIKAVYSEYNNKPQVKNAVFVEVYKGEGGGEEGEYSYDYEPTEITTVTITADELNIQDYSADFGVVYISLNNTESGEFAVLEFNKESFDGLEVGTYPIDDTEEFGTFWASPGGDDEYDYGCYVGVPDPTDPEYYNPYYMISGTVQIGASGDIYVRATSYNGSTIIVTYVAQEQGIQNTTAKVSTGAIKTMRNGMLLIEKNGKTFNAIGQIVK